MTPEIVAYRTRSSRSLLTDRGLSGPPVDSGVSETGRQRRVLSDIVWSSATGMEITAGFEIMAISASPIEVGVTPPRWLRDSAESILEVMDLPEDWNSYGARPVDPEAVREGLRVLNSILDSDTPAPTVHPTPSGGVTFEWHTSRVDIELEITPEGRVIALAEDLIAKEEWEDDITSDLRRLRPEIDKLDPLPIRA